ncbi:MAG: alpha/beta hydrolase [Chloroherpetonaceae bacterium]|nr:alpha/beta hydrolase [Chthonomonadaceae bacterium]MDW8206514.1 alpha/beta hydrolase [Chloroherpetonaceae bacterium]
MPAQHLPDYIRHPPDAAGVYAIWPGSGVPDSSATWTWHEQTMRVPLAGGAIQATMVRNVVIPTVTMFQPDPGTANGTSLIIAPGGSFLFLMMDHEGYDVARWVTSLGVTAFVLRYRLAHMPEDDDDMLAFMGTLGSVLPIQDRFEERPPVGNEKVEEARCWGEEDGHQAIRFVREHALEWGLDPQKIGIAGFSAGGGVAIAAAMEYDAHSRPDFVAGIYPGYRTATLVPPDAPPLFLATADDDVLVAPLSTVRLYEAWRRAHRPVELHVFSGGQHGFGMRRQHLPSDAWTAVFQHWLDVQGYLTTR